MRTMLMAATLLLAAGAARADALADMKAALARASVDTPIRAMVETRSWHKMGEGKEAEEESGHASVLVEDDERGLSVVHDKEILARMERELRARARNPNSKTPTLSALDDASAREILVLTSAAEALLRAIERGEFKGERADNYQGKPARALRFEMPITTLSDRERKYAKKFVSVLDVWIGADGMPLASRLQQSASGRAFIVISFEFDNQEEKVFAVAGGRLLTVRRETRSHFSGPGERDERKVTTTLQVRS